MPSPVNPNQSDIDIRTKKSDWLNTLLAKTSNIFVSGHESAPRLMGLPTDSVVTFRFAGNRKKTYLLLLTIESQRTNWEAIVSALLQEGGVGHAVVSGLSEKLNQKMLCILCGGEQEHKFGLIVDGKLKPVAGQELKQHLGNIDPDLISNANGAVKAINTSLNDEFQRWGRENLSKYLVLNDFDAFSMTSEKVLVIYELKRVQEDLKTWRPYLDDEPNYAALRVMCNGNRARLRVIAYQPSNEDYVAVHYIVDSSSSGIEGRVIVCKPEYITEALLGEGYVSTRGRVRT